MVEISQFECLSSPAAAKLAKQLVISTKLMSSKEVAEPSLEEDEETFLEPGLGI